LSSKACSRNISYLVSRAVSSGYITGAGTHSETETLCSTNMFSSEYDGSMCSACLFLLQANVHGHSSCSWALPSTVSINYVTPAFK
jgi:hypothetical protein